MTASGDRPDSASMSSAGDRPASAMSAAGELGVPDSRLCTAATEFARRASEPCLFNHVMRTFAFGAAFAEARRITIDRELFYVAAVLHDIGLTELAPRGQRFEITGADAAKELLAREGMREADIEIVWDAIALHTTVGVPPRKRPEIMLVQLGAAVDVGFAPVEIVAQALPAILDAWPRLSFKSEMLRYLERLYDRDPVGALQSPIVADVIERRRGVRARNACDVIDAAAFAT
jgi:hypothetical protein